MEPVRGNRWAVRTADARRTLGYGDNRAAAEALRQNEELLVAAAAAGAKPEQQGDKWIIAGPDQQPLATFDSESDARAIVEKYARDLARSRPRRRRGLDLVVGRHRRRRSRHLGRLEPRPPHAGSHFPPGHRPHVSKHSPVSAT